MPELGKYATEVLSAYGVTLGLIAVLVGVSVLQARQMRNRLREQEKRRDTNG